MFAYFVIGIVAQTIIIIERAIRFPWLWEDGHTYWQFWLGCIVIGMLMYWHGRLQLYLKSTMSLMDNKIVGSTDPSIFRFERGEKLWSIGIAREIYRLYYGKEYTKQTKGLIICCGLESHLS